MKKYIKILCYYPFMDNQKDALAKTKLGGWEYDIVYPAYKCNMTDIMASLGLAQLKRYPKILERRKQIIETYDKELLSDTIDALKHYGNDYSSSGHLYLLRLLGRDENYRNKVIEKMAEKGIATNVHYKPLPMHTAYKNLGFNIKDYPNAFEMYKNGDYIAIAYFALMKQAEYVIESLKEVINNK